MPATERLSTLYKLFVLLCLYTGSLQRCKLILNHYAYSAGTWGEYNSQIPGVGISGLQSSSTQYLRSVSLLGWCLPSQHTCMSCWEVHLQKQEHYCDNTLLLNFFSFTLTTFYHPLLGLFFIECINVSIV